ncbi:MAG: hypothetical protein JNK78_01315 [Planctomycetes bacterium]|nr:hypothetical protein [Planctomycetota bacterium]
MALLLAVSGGRRASKHLVGIVAAAFLAVAFALWLAASAGSPTPPGAPPMPIHELAPARRQAEGRGPEANAMEERVAGAEIDGQVRGRIVHVADGEGVPFVRVAVRDRVGEEEVSTDRDGAFATRRSFAADCELRTWDPFVRRQRSPQLLPWTRSDAADEADRGQQAPWQPLAPGIERARVEIALATGPTYFVTAQLPEGVQLADVMVMLARPEETVTGAARSRMEEKAELREDPATAGEYWCRLPPSSVVDDLPAHLVLSARRGSWCGRASVRQVQGVQREPVVVPLSAPGAVRGVVRVRGGRPRPNYPVALAQGEGVGLQRLDARTDDDGRYEFSFVMPGPAVLEVATEDVDAARMGVLVRGGVTSERDIALASRPIAGWVSGTITTESGRPFESCGVVLSSRDDASVWREAFVRWTEVDGRFEMRWAFENVPAVPCEVTLRPGAPCAVSLRSVSVMPPSVGIRFHVNDRPALVPVTFRTAGTAVGAWSLFLAGDAGWQQRVDRADGTGFTLKLPVGERVSWIAAGDARRLGRGDATPAVGAANVVEIDGREGFSALVVCDDARNFRPVAGVPLFADGAAVGTTDAAGRVWIDVAGRPARLGIPPGAGSIRGDTHVPADVDADGTFRPGREGATLRLLLLPGS